MEPNRRKSGAGWKFWDKDKKQYLESINEAQRKHDQELLNAQMANIREQERIRQEAQSREDEIARQLREAQRKARDAEELRRVQQAMEKKREDERIRSEALHKERVQKEEAEAREKQAIRRREAERKIRNISPEAVRDLREQIREKYALDNEIWSLRDGYAEDRDVIQKRMDRSDALWDDIRAKLMYWRAAQDQDQRVWNDKEWVKVEEILERLDPSSGKVRVWRDNPPWDDDDEEDYFSE